VTIYVTEDGGQTVHGVPDHFQTTIMNRVNSTLDGVRLATDDEVRVAGFPVPSDESAA
jgi:hypothetical protein